MYLYQDSIKFRSTLAIYKVQIGNMFNNGSSFTYIELYLLKKIPQTVRSHIIIVFARIFANF